jgi:alpha-glucosidase (family GH31 glycosyl hydrolase)
MRTKYSLIRYYYTELSLLSANGGIFFKPLYFEFPTDEGSFDTARIEYDFMLGSALKVSINSNTLG